MDGVNQTVIGVMPANFAYPLFWGQLQAIRPLVYAAAWQHQRSEHWLDTIARLKPGVSLVQAQADLNTVAARLAQQYPDVHAGTGLRIVPLHETALDGTGRNVTWLTLALSGFALLIACINLANLQLARGAARAHDFAVRTALGASRVRLMREILAESVVLALAGGGVGILLAGWLNDFLSPRLALAGGLPITLTLDWCVLGFALLASFSAALISGAVPAWLAARADVTTALKAQSRGATDARSRHRLRHVLIVAEIAFTLMVLAGAGFFIRGLQCFTSRDPGWQTAGLLTGAITLPKTLPTERYVNAGGRRQFYDRLLQRLTQLPESSTPPSRPHCPSSATATRLLSRLKTAPIHRLASKHSQIMSW